MTVYGYVRVSTEEQVAGTSLGDQRRIITGLAMASDVPTDSIVWLDDGGVSGVVAIFDRPAGAALADAGKGDVVLVAKLDRFTRDMLDLLTVLKEWDAAGVRLIIGSFGDVIGPRANGSAGRLLLEIMGVFAGYERSVIKERQRAGQLAKRLAGGHIGGAAPFGFHVVGTGRAARLVHDPEQQAAIATICQARGALSLRAIAAAVQERHGIKVSAPTVRAVLARNPSAGDAGHG